eukprot:3045749-Pyramimonas_sp.AAC.1
MQQETSVREEGGADGPSDGQADTEGVPVSKARPSQAVRPDAPPPPRRPDVQDDRANDDVAESPYSAGSQTGAAGEDHSWFYSDRDTWDWSRPPRARRGHGCWPRSWRLQPRRPLPVLHGR